MKDQERGDQHCSFKTGSAQVLGISYTAALEKQICMLEQVFERKVKREGQDTHLARTHSEIHEGHAARKCCPVFWELNPVSIAPSTSFELYEDCTRPA
jgi:hypothetical protein